MEISNKSGNPFDQNLILKLVLEHVGRVSLPDLMTCRMVNHSWNRVAVQILEQQHSYAMELDCNKLREFKALLWNTQMSRMNSEHKTELASLRLSLGIYPVNFSDGVIPLSDGAETGQLLMSYPHLRPAFLTLCFHSDSDSTQPRPFRVYSNHELYNLFQLASTSLTSIKIWDKILEDDERPPYFEEFDFESYASVEFPRLASIHYDFCPDTCPKNESTHLTKHLVSIIQQAPKLTKLYVYSWGAHSEKAIGSYRSLLEICAAKTDLEELDIYEGGEESVLKILPAFKFPKLRTLRLKKSFRHTRQDKGEELSQFLEHNCPALTAIFLRWSYYGIYPIEDDHDEPAKEFPVLPNILHFGLYPEYGLKPGHLKIIHATFTAELAKKFPSLQSMSITLEVLLMLGAYLKESGHQFPPTEDPEEYPTFPNVTSLEVYINLVVLEEEEENDLFLRLVRASRMYCHTFPALRKLVLKPWKSLLWGSATAKSLQAIDFLASRSSLQFLEIHNCPTAWINNFRTKLPGMKTLKIFLPRLTGAESDGAACFADDRPPIEIMKVLSTFPTLEHLQIDNQVVSRAEMQTIRNLISRFEES